MDKAIMLQFLKEFEQKFLQMEDTVDNIIPSASPDVQLAPEPIMDESVHEHPDVIWRKQRDYKNEYNRMVARHERERKELHKKYGVGHRARPKFFKNK